MRTITVYADITDPLSYLADRRATRLAAAGSGAVAWCWVVADPGRPVTGRRLDASAAAGLAAEVERLAEPGERRPELPATLSSARAVTSALAEAAKDGVADELRAAVMAALWERAVDLSDPAAVKRLVARLLNPTPVPARLRMLGTGLVSLADADPAVAVRRSGGTISASGGPLTSAGQHLLDEWREGWAHRNFAALPLVVTELGEALPGDRGLAYLSRVAGPVPTAARPVELVTVA